MIVCILFRYFLWSQFYLSSLTTTLPSSSHFQAFTCSCPAVVVVFLPLGRRSLPPCGSALILYSTVVAGILSTSIVLIFCYNHSRNSNRKRRSLGLPFDSLHMSIIRISFWSQLKIALFLQPWIFRIFLLGWSNRSIVHVYCTSKARKRMLIHVEPKCLEGMVWAACLLCRMGASNTN